MSGEVQKPRSPSKSERQREGVAALLTLLVGDGTSEEGKDECDAASA